MDTKALKKQMGAAIAMVLVAAIALGSATFAWFVTNNEVKATTSTISAQSNAAFMTIEKGTTGAKNTNQSEVTTDVKTKALYPATFGEETKATLGKFSTGYGSGVSDSTLKGDLHLCSDPTSANAEAGSAAAAVNGHFALQQDYNISTRGQKLTALQIKEVTGETNDSGLKTAQRILVTNNDGTKWEVWGLNTAGNAYERKLSSNQSSSADAADKVTFADSITSDSETVVHVYLYYEGKDTNVTTQNLQQSNLTATNAVTVTFTANADNKQ